MGKLSDLIIDNLLKKIEEDGLTPWQQPYRFHNAMNYASNHVYTGINRWLVPEGEYLTSNQIDKINEKLDKDDKYLYRKGIRWYRLVFYSTYEGKPEPLPDGVDRNSLEDGKYFNHNFLRYKYIGKGLCVEVKYVMRYYRVCNIKDLKSPNGGVLPSKLGKEVELKCFKPEELFNNYVKREGIEVNYYEGIPSYYPLIDKIRLNKYFNSEAEYWSAVFHEAIHSTGHEKRLNRRRDDYAFEEMVAEIGSALLCAESGITDILNPGPEFKNQAAYIKYWKGILKDKPNVFFKAASKAEEAFRFFMGDLLIGENIGKGVDQ